MANLIDLSEIDLNPQEVIIEIHRLVKYLETTDWRHCPEAEFLELLEKGEDWVKEMSKFLGVLLREGQ